MPKFKFHRTNVDLFIAELSDETRLQLVKELDLYMQIGTVPDDAALRVEAARMIETTTGVRMAASPSHMLEIGNACHRYLGMKAYEAQI
jgi:hypothetical protein